MEWNGKERTQSEAEQEPISQAAKKLKPNAMLKPKQIEEGTRRTDERADGGRTLANSQFNRLINILLSPSGAASSAKCACSKGHEWLCLGK